MLILLLANDTKMITQTYNYKYFIKIKFFLVNIWLRFLKDKF